MPPICCSPKVCLHFSLKTLTFVSKLPKKQELIELQAVLGFPIKLVILSAQMFVTSVKISFTSLSLNVLSVPNSFASLASLVELKRETTEANIFIRSSEMTSRSLSTLRGQREKRKSF